jgi:hypothetical protein
VFIEPLPGNALTCHNIINGKYGQFKSQAWSRLTKKVPVIIKEEAADYAC